MMRLVRNLRELEFGKLMEVYAGSTGGSLAAEQDFYQYLKEGFFTRPEDCYCLWEVGGRPVSALRLQSYRDGLLLEALETAPSQRRKGYAQALVRAVVEAFADKTIYVHIAFSNRASIALHEKCGFLKLSDGAVYADGSVTYRAATYIKCKISEI